MQKIPGLTLVFCLAHGISAQAGWIIEGRHQEGQNAPLTQTTYLDAAGIRVETADNVTLFQPREKKLIMIDPADKSYQVLDQESIKRIVANASAAMKQMQEAMAGMTPEQKAMLDKILGGQSLPGQSPAAPAKPPATTYKLLEESVKIASWTTNHYEVLEDGVKESEIWVASPGSLAIDKELLKLFSEMGGFFKDLASALPMAPPAASNSLEMELPGLNAPAGVPVKEIIFENGAPASTWEITRASSSDVAAEKFQIPPDYKAKDPLAPAN